MKTEHLHELWAGPDNSRLTTKQFSFRLPVHIAAKIAALCDMYPSKNRTQIVADLLTSALDELEKHLPQAIGERVMPSEDDREEFGIEPQEPVYCLGGPRGQFRDLANHYYREYETELGNPYTAPLFPEILGRREFFTKK